MPPVGIKTALAEGKGIKMEKLEDQIRILDFPDLGDERGNLVVVEGGSAIPFDIKRIFYIYGSDSEVVQGSNANLRSEFVMINVA